MLRNRLILSLLMRSDGIFVNSRGFQLQNVGELRWIQQYLDFESIDELVLLNIDRREKDVSRFASQIRELGKFCFVPITAGGGVRSLDDFRLLLDSGADKISVNSAFFDDPEFITRAAEQFGSQCTVASIDVRLDGDRAPRCFTRDGSHDTGLTPVEWACRLEALGAGELLLRSIERDGSGKGYDVDLVRSVSDAVSIPVIASGGVGNFDHLVEGIRDGRASAVSAGNIFHYIGHGLNKAKAHLRDQNLNFPLWNF